MNSTGFLSVRDYLTYYLGGLAWLVLLVAVVVPLADPTESELEHIKSIGDAIGTPLMAALALVVPYVVGFTLNWPGLLATRLVRWALGDARWSVIGADEKHQARVHRYCRPLRRETIGLIVDQMTAVFGPIATKPEAPKRSTPGIAKIFNQIGGLLANAVLGRKGKSAETRKWTVLEVADMFNLIRSYLANAGLPAAQQAIRNQLLANLAESLLVPVPAALVIIGAKLHFQSPTAMLFSLRLDWVFFVAAAVSVSLLTRQYLYSHEFWAKHVYWAFADAGGLGASSGVGTFRRPVGIRPALASGASDSTSASVAPDRYKLKSGP
jgi:hypothetical protein